METTALDILKGRGLGESRTVKENEVIVNQLVEHWKQNVVSLTTQEVENTVKYSEELGADEFMGLWNAITNILGPMLFLQKKKSLTPEEQQTIADMQPKVPNVRLFVNQTQTRLRAMIG